MRPLRILVFGLAVSLAILGFRWWWHRSGGAISPREGSPFRNAEIPGSPSPSVPAAGISEKPLEPGQAPPEITLTDQRGREIRISDFRGNILVLAFFYTHCELPSMCPLTTAKMVEASDRLREAGRRDIRFLMVSFDPGRDRPERLREYAARFEIDPDLFSFTTGEDQDIRSLGRALNTYYRTGAAGVFDHNISVSLFDRDGIFRSALHGPGWKVEDLVAAVESLSGDSPVPQS